MCVRAVSRHLQVMVATLLSDGLNTSPHPGRTTVVLQAAIPMYSQGSQAFQGPAGPWALAKIDGVVRREAAPSSSSCYQLSHSINAIMKRRHMTTRPGWSKHSLILGHNFDQKFEDSFTTSEMGPTAPKPRPVDELASPVYSDSCIRGEL
jgi:hypothetical protein